MYVVEGNEIVILKASEMPCCKTGNISEVSFYLKNYVKFVLHYTDLGVLM